MTTALTLAPMHAFPGLSWAQARPLVFATFTGSWEEAHKAVLVPAFRKATGNAPIVLDPMLSVDQIAKVTAARANPPIDVMLHDPGPGCWRSPPGWWSRIRSPAAPITRT